MPDKSRSDSVVLRGQPERKEAEAGSTIRPGALVELQSDGTVDSGGTTFTAGADVRRAFAVENDIEGLDLSSNYATGNRCLYAVFQAGHEVSALVAASAPAIVVGDSLSVTASGTVAKSGATHTVIGYALQNVDNSSGTSTVRIKMEVK